MSLSSEQKEKINFLEEFDTDLDLRLLGNTELGDMKLLRKSLNERVPMAEEIVREAGCLKLIAGAPPPNVGGPTIQNVNPFNVLFDEYHDVPFIPHTQDMIQKAIGVIQSGRPEEVKEAKKMRETTETEEVVSEELAAPEEITLMANTSYTSPLEGTGSHFPLYCVFVWH